GLFDVGGGLPLVELCNGFLEYLRVVDEVVPDDALDLALLRGGEFLRRNRQRQHQQGSACSGQSLDHRHHRFGSSVQAAGQRAWRLPLPTLLQAEKERGSRAFRSSW